VPGSLTSAAPGRPSRLSPCAMAPRGRLGRRVQPGKGSRHCGQDGAAARAQHSEMQARQKLCPQSSITGAQKKSRQMEQMASSRSSSAAAMAGARRPEGLGWFHFRSWERSETGLEWVRDPLAVGSPRAVRDPLAVGSPRAGQGPPGCGDPLGGSGTPGRVRDPLAVGTPQAGRGPPGCGDPPGGSGTPWLWDPRAGQGPPGCGDPPGGSAQPEEGEHSPPARLPSCTCLNSRQHRCSDLAEPNPAGAPLSSAGGPPSVTPRTVQTPLPQPSSPSSCSSYVRAAHSHSGFPLSAFSSFAGCTAAKTKFLFIFWCFMTPFTVLPPRSQAGRSLHRDVCSPFWLSSVFPRRFPLCSTFQQQLTVLRSDCSQPQLTPG